MYEAWPITLMEQHTLRVSGDRKLGRIFGLMTDEAI
jgi:hypothetical protein